MLDLKKIYNFDITIQNLNLSYSGDTLFTRLGVSRSGDVYMVLMNKENTRYEEIIVDFVTRVKRVRGEMVVENLTRVESRVYKELFKARNEIKKLKAEGVGELYGENKIS